MNSSTISFLWKNTRYFQGLLALLGVVICWVGSSFAIQGIFTEFEYSKPFFITYFNTCTFSFYLAIYWFTTTPNQRHWSRSTERQPLPSGDYVSFDETQPLLSAQKSTTVVVPTTTTTTTTTITNATSSSFSGMVTPSLTIAAPIEPSPCNASLMSVPPASNKTTSITGEDIDRWTAKMEINLSTTHDHLPVHEKDRSMSLHEIASLSAKFCIIWFLANWTQNASLAYTSVASSTVIGSTSGLFTLLVGSMAGVEQLSFARCIAATISLVGVALVTYAPAQSSTPSDSPSLSSHLWGDALALLGAFFYGCYTVLLKRQMHNETRADTTLFFGFVGIFNMFGMWPILLLLHWLGLETFALPGSSTIWTILCINAFLGTFLSDYLWLLAVLLTSPLVATLGLALSIPIAFFGDIVFKGLIVNVSYWIGAGLVLCGFIGVNSATLWEQRLPTT
ncbi:hypothetical protein BDF19DRAFT_441379 [Syncephalis fuscata]|nr:hypothetical protein BDF19DRAFT_441379 [Syncephalis fuscata]